MIFLLMLVGNGTIGRVVHRSAQSKKARGGGSRQETQREKELAKKKIH